jgi:midasin (ATPase involved in ribosome maturation)
MVEYLARRTGHRFVRINNHEHTDLQEYLGTYISDSSGKLVFQEGILVEAVRKVLCNTFHRLHVLTQFTTGILDCSG